MNDIILEIQGIDFGYTPGSLLFQDFNLTLHKGEVISIVGASGSGKSTLLELITGNLQPHKGSISHSSLAQIYQDPYTSFHPTYDIINQLSDTCKLHRLQEFCDKLQLAPSLLKKKPHELSGGQLQRASILRALLMQPKLLLADEPTSALDNVVQLDVMKLLMQFLDEVGILLITHDHALASWCSDRIISLES